MDLSPRASRSLSGSSGGTSGVRLYGQQIEADLLAGSRARRSLLHRAVDLARRNMRRRSAGSDSALAQYDGDHVWGVEGVSAHSG